MAKLWHKCHGQLVCVVLRLGRGQAAQAVIKKQSSSTGQKAEEEIIQETQYREQKEEEQISQWKGTVEALWDGMELIVTLQPKSWPLLFQRMTHETLH